MKNPFTNPWDIQKRHPMQGANSQHDYYTFFNFLQQSLGLRMNAQMGCFYSARHPKPSQVEGWSGKAVRCLFREIAMGEAMLSLFYNLHQAIDSIIVARFPRCWVTTMCGRVSLTFPHRRHRWTPATIRCVLFNATTLRQGRSMNERKITDRKFSGTIPCVSRHGQNDREVTFFGSPMKCRKD